MPLRLSDFTVVALMDREAVDEPLPDAAVIVAVPAVAEATVVTVNVAEVAPAATVTVAGTVANVLEELKFTTNPPVGAASASFTVPVTEVPPMTDELLKVKDEG